MAEVGVEVKRGMLESSRLVDGDNSEGVGNGDGDGVGNDGVGDGDGVGGEFDMAEVLSVCMKSKAMNLT